MQCRRIQTNLFELLTFFKDEIGVTKLLSYLGGSWQDGEEENELDQATKQKRQSWI